MFDTHSHLQFKVFESQIDEVIDRARKVGVRGIVAVGTDVKSSQKAVELAKQFKGVYAAVGMHPHHVFEHLYKDPQDFSDTDSITDHIAQIELLLREEKVVAVGETGTDKHAYKSTMYREYGISDEFIQLQKQVFASQIKLAKRYGKSLIIHNRKAVSELLMILEENWDKSLEYRSVFHCVEPDLRILQFAVDNKVFIGIDGDITYDKEKQKFLKYVPTELLVLETDSPFFVPQPLLEEGVKVNESANLKFISHKVAEILKFETKRIEEITYENSLRLFLRKW